MNRVTLFAEIILPLPVKGTFTYRVPYELNEFIKEGHRVSVQFGRKKVYSGIVQYLHEKVPTSHEPKYILSLLDEFPIVNNTQLKFWKWISQYYMSTIGDVMSAALPGAFKLASESKVLLSKTFVPDKVNLSESEFIITEGLLKNNKLTIDEISKLVGFKKVLPVIKSMIDNNLIIMEEELTESYKPKTEKYVKINSMFTNDELLQELMDNLGKRAHKQLELLLQFISLTGLPLTESSEISKKVLLEKSKSSQATLKALTDKEVFHIEEREVSRFNMESKNDLAKEVELNENQDAAIKSISESFETKNVTLLHGITSSGKTEIYIKLIKENISSGKQVLYLLPEIALTAQIINRLKVYFGNEVGIYHSRYNKNERAEVWNNILANEESVHKYKIIVGPRSALFLPFSNLGLIIVDEEHDSSYKQYDPAPRYNARDAAIYLATLHNAKVLLGSATPSIESYHNAQTGKYGFVELMVRYGNMKLPEIRIVDLKEEHKRRKMKSHFSSVLLDEVKDALQKNKQSILFQNRRGFSLRIECDVCHWVPECSNCDVTLTYHKYSELLKCHYCGYSTTVPNTCPDCGNSGLKMQGFGTEKISEELSYFVDKARIDRMDLDTTRKKNAHSRIINDFEEGRTNILVGTQMVTKGLDFDNVQVVGILNADSLLSFPDFRSAERSYQLMSQVSGRAGRKGDIGKVIIQAWRPDNSILHDVLKHDYKSMYLRILSDRYKFLYPPYYRLIIIRMKHRNSDIVNKCAASFAHDLREKFGKLVYGPEYPLVGRIRNYYIKQTMLKIPKGMNLAETKAKIIASAEQTKTIKEFKSVIVQFDVDPQ